MKKKPFNFSSFLSSVFLWLFCIGIPAFCLIGLPVISFFREVLPSKKANVSAAEKTITVIQTVPSTTTPRPTSAPKSNNYSSSSANFFGTVSDTQKRSWMDDEKTVYVSVSGHRIHLYSDCSGMRNYYEMTYGEACEHGYDHCQKCFG